MSVFIGSFVWKNDSTSPTVNASTRTTSAAYTISTQSYIIAITNATQTEIDTLSAGRVYFTAISSWLSTFKETALSGQITQPTFRHTEPVKLKKLFVKE